MKLMNKRTYTIHSGASYCTYQPEAFLSGSWGKNAAGFDNHFGGVIDLDPDSKRSMAGRLGVNAGEHPIKDRDVTSRF